MKLVYTNENRFLVSNAKNIVENAGIKAVLRNEYASGGVGELSPLSTWLELWVLDDSDYSRVEELLASAFGGLDKSDPNAELEWHCRACGESNDQSFECCWHCQLEQD